jgi:dTDP-4-amino-4,6-dideoxygalactose transaminase
MDMIGPFAKERGIYVIEACAQSYGASLNQRPSGTFGKIGCFSFYPTKNLGGFGDGGALVTEDKDVYDLLRKLRNYGKFSRWNSDIIGYNSRLDELQAALLNVKIKHIDSALLSRRKVADYYLNNIKNEKIILPLLYPGAVHSWHLFVVRTNNRSSLIKHLNQNGVGWNIHYPIPPHKSKAYIEFLSLSLPITEQYSQEILSLPLYDFMSLKEAKYVTDVINSY